MPGYAATQGCPLATCIAWALCGDFWKQAGYPFEGFIPKQCKTNEGFCNVSCKLCYDTPEPPDGFISCGDDRGEGDTRCCFWPDCNNQYVDGIVVPATLLWIDPTYVGGDGQTFGSFLPRGEMSTKTWELIPGITSPWCPRFDPYTVTTFCPEGKRIEQTVGVANYKLAINQSQIFVPPALITITQSGSAFSPSLVNAQVGDTIRWVWSAGNHTVTSGSDCIPDGPFNEVLDSDNQTFEWVVPASSGGTTIPYFCSPHCYNGMQGSIIVAGGLPSSTLVFPDCNSENTNCWTGHTDHVMINGISDNRGFGLSHWFTSISSYKGKVLVNHENTKIKYGDTDMIAGITGPVSHVVQGATYFSYFSVWDTWNSGLEFINRDNLDNKSTAEHPNPLSTDVFGFPYFMDGNKAENTPQVIIPGIRVNNCGGSPVVGGQIGCTCTNFTGLCSPSGCSACTDVVCAFNPLCCELEWDSGCLDMANEYYNIGGSSPVGFTGSDGVFYDVGVPFPPGVLCGSTGGYDAGTTAEGDVFASLWQNTFSGISDYKPYGLNYYSVLGTITDSTSALVNYSDRRVGVFGERPDLILFRLANAIYPNSWMVGFSGCTAPNEEEERIEGQTACSVDWTDCDEDKYTQSSVLYGQVAVGARHALVTMGEYGTGLKLGDHVQKVFPYIVQFSGQTFGAIDRTKTTWSTQNINLSSSNNSKSSPITNLNWSGLPIVTGITYPAIKDKLYSHGFSGETEIFEVWDIDNNHCSFKDGKVINPALCGSGLTSCHRYGITFGHADHPIWNNGINEMPKVSIISASALCTKKGYLPSLLDSWEWISAGNTGESCAVCRCHPNLSDILEVKRHVICWGGRYDESSIPLEAWDFNLGDEFSSEETGYRHTSKCTNPDLEGIYDFNMRYQPCQVDIKGSSPVIYYRSYPYDMIGIGRHSYYFDPRGGTNPLFFTRNASSFNIRGKTRYWDGVWKIINSFGDTTHVQATKDVTPGEGVKYIGLNRLALRTWDENIFLGENDFALPDMRYSGGPQFTPTYPIISTDAWFNNRYSGYTITEQGCCGFTTGACCVDKMCTNSDTSECWFAGGSFISGEQCTPTICNIFSSSSSGSSSSSSSGGGGRPILCDWATLLEPLPDPAVVTDANLRAAIVASGFAWRVQDNGTGIEMLLVPAGTFTMGCSPSISYPSCGLDESPTHQVALSAFYIGRYEVTQAQWLGVMESNPSFYQGQSDSPSRPVEQVSWNMIASGSTSFMYLTGLRLPTEAEWEYAYRAGTTTAFHSYPAQPNGFNDDTLLENIAWFYPAAGGQTHAVGGKLANGLGLHDMSGNVWEWCQDWYGPYSSVSVTNPTGPTTGSYRLLRGGSWGDNSDYCRASLRNSGDTPDNLGNSGGFRAARNP